LQGFSYSHCLHLLSRPDCLRLFSIQHDWHVRSIWDCAIIIRRDSSSHSGLRRSKASCRNVAGVWSPTLPFDKLSLSLRVHFDNRHSRLPPPISNLGPRNPRDSLTHQPSTPPPGARVRVAVTLAGDRIQCGEPTRRRRPTNRGTDRLSCSTPMLDIHDQAVL
jgi:hypothetical protein